jgi:hypothetical protein
MASHTRLLFGCAAIVAMSFTTPVLWAQAQNPIQAMKDAWKKAKEQQRQQQNGQKPQNSNQQQNGGNSTTSTPGGLSIPHSTAKIDAALMAPSETGMPFGISDPSAHAAAVSHRGSRKVLLYDGAEGPKFDEIVPLGAGPVEFSPDGTRYAYTGRSGNERVIMLDGKEVFRFDESKYALQPPFNGAHDVEFSPNSKHFFFEIHPVSTTGNESRATRLFWDGVPGPQFADQIVISPDGDHYAYFTRQPTANGDIVHLFIDGKPAGYLGSEPQFTADGKHLFTKVSYSRPTPYTEVLLDGKPIMKATGVQLYMPPAGYNFVAVLGTGIREDYRFLAVGNRRVPGSECRGSGGYDQITFTPDGKHWAARCQTQSGSHFVIADGKKGQEYPMTSELIFTADGTVTYFGIQGYVGNQSYVVIGEEESQGYEGLSPAMTDASHVGVPGPTVVGPHLAYVSRSSNPRGTVMHIDGKAFPAIDSGKLVFSPDGKHFAFVTTGNDPRWGTVVLDGVPQPGTYMDMSQMQRGIHTYFPPIQFSPDSNHVAWYGTSPSDSGSGIFLDGKFFHSGEAGISPQHVSFSPDSKHLVYGNIVRAQPDIYGVFIDGRLAAQVDLALAFNQNESAWQWAPDGSLIVFGQDADGLKRFHINLPEDTSLATMGGSSKTLAQN